MRVAIPGTSGLIGRALTGGLVEGGDAPRTRTPTTDDDAKLIWNTSNGFDRPDALSGYDAVVHLAVESVGVPGVPRPEQTPARDQTSWLALSAAAEEAA